jgi:hypothetical protein
MQIDTNKLKSFLNLNDEDFKKKLADTAKAGGIEDDKISQMLKDVKSVKKTIGNLSEQDIINAVNALGSDKLESLIKNVRNK